MTLIFPAGPASAPAASDPAALLKGECRRVTDETSAPLRKSTLILAGLALGKEARITMEAAEAALMTAAQAGNYPAEFGGQDLRTLIRGWLFNGRRPLPGWDRERYRDWAFPLPHAQPAVAGEA